MSTPITDAVAKQAFPNETTSDYSGYVTMMLHARRLETDRAALMEVCDRLAELDLNATDDSLVRFIVLAHQNSAKAAITAARANFPQP